MGDAEERGPLNLVFTDTDMDLVFMDLVLPDTPLEPLMSPGAPKELVTWERDQLMLKLSPITVMDMPDTVTVSLPDTLALEVTTWEREKPKLNLTTVMLVSVTTAVVTMEVTVTVTVMAMVTTVRSYKNL